MAFRKIAGAAGLGVTVLILTVNILLGATGRTLGETPLEDIVGFFSDYGWAVSFISAIAPVVWVLMAIFAVGIVTATRDRAGQLNPWALVGLVGIAMQNVVFGRAIAADVVLVNTDNLAAKPDSTLMLWDQHTVAMTMNHVSIGIAILGFGIAATASGLLPMWTRPVALVGSAVLIVSAATVSFAVDSDIPPIGVPGVFIWLAWIVYAAVRLLRHEDRTATEPATASLHMASRGV
jgi:hypothetical protein